MSSLSQLSSYVNLLMFSKTEKLLFKKSFLLNREYETEKYSVCLPPPPTVLFLVTNLTDMQSHVCLSTRASSELAGATERIQSHHPGLQMRNPERER